MKVRSYILGVVTASAVATTSLFGAESFDFVFRVLRFAGECQITPPDATVPIPAKAGKAYPYASTARTGKKSSATIALSANNECRMKDETSVYFVDQEKSRDLRVLQLLAGQIQVDLDINAKLPQMPNEVTVNTVAASATTRASRFLALVHPTNELTEATFTCESGTLRIKGPQFEIPALKPTDTVEVSGTQDQSYSRLAVIRGVIPISLRDSEGNPFTYEAKQRAVIKFWIKRSETGKAVSVAFRILNANGETERVKAADGTDREMSYQYRLAETPETN